MHAKRPGGSVAAVFVTAYHGNVQRCGHRDAQWVLDTVPCWSWLRGARLAHSVTHGQLSAGKLSGSSADTINTV